MVEGNLYHRPDGKRECLTCKRARNRGVKPAAIGIKNEGNNSGRSWGRDSGAGRNGSRRRLPGVVGVALQNVGRNDKITQRSNESGIERKPTCPRCGETSTVTAWGNGHRCVKCKANF